LDALLLVVLGPTHDALATEREQKDDTEEEAQTIVFEHTPHRRHLCSTPMVMQ
jgi:hypothetical protein